MSSRTCDFSGVDAADYAVVAGVPPAGFLELQPTRPPLQESGYNVTLDAAFPIGLRDLCYLCGEISPRKARASA